MASTSNRLSLYFSWIIVLALDRGCHGNSDAKRLYDDLFMNPGYNKLIRPVREYKDAVKVNYGLRFAQLIDVQEKHEIMTTNMWVEMEWYDHGLKWDPFQYGGVDMIYIPTETIWIPDIVLYNNADGDYTVTIMTKAILHYTGLIKWNPPAVFKSYCNIDVEYFPFDLQMCHLKIGPWANDGLKIDIQHKLASVYAEPDDLEPFIDEAIDMSDFVESQEWDVILVPGKKNIVVYPCCSIPYPDITFNITLRRKTLFYSINIVIPLVCINILILTGFYVPCDCEEKISISITILLSLSMFQLLLFDLVPATSIKMPLLGKYILFTLVLVTGCIMCQVLVLNIRFRLTYVGALPEPLKKIFLGVLAGLLCMPKPTEEEQDQEIEDQIDWSLGHSDLSDFVNPYKKRFRQRKSIIADAMKSMDSGSQDMPGLDGRDPSAFCRACAQRRLHNIPPNMQKAMDGATFIAKHHKDDEENRKQEKHEIMTTNMWVELEWYDDGLRWDPAQYGGVDMIYVPSEFIWLPDVVLSNNADGDYTVTIMTKAILHYTGLIKWNPPAVFKSYCNIDVEYFPFDLQMCHLKFLPWTHDGFKIDIQHKLASVYAKSLNDTEPFIEKAIDMSDFVPSQEWDVILVPAQKNIVVYPCCSEPFPDITFNITLRRKTLFYSINIIIPVVCINLLTLTGFYVPCDCEEKISISITILLSLSMFQLLLFDLVPATSIKMPLLGKYILFTLVLVTGCIMCQVVVLNVRYRATYVGDVPAPIQKLFLGVIAGFLCMPKPTEEDQDKEVEDQIDWSLAQSDLSHFVNPYKKKFRQRKSIIADAMKNMDSNYQQTSGFVGQDSSTTSGFCHACAQSQQPFPPNAQKAMEGAEYIAKHHKEEEETRQKKSEWMYLAMVIDRMLLLVYTSLAVVFTLVLLLNAPALYDSRPALQTHKNKSSYTAI